MASENETSFLQRAYYQWRRNKWRISRHRFHSHRLSDVRTAFLLGVQGGGLSLISRCLRRAEGVISVTGDHRYWGGADEMHTVLGKMLPPAFAGTVAHVPLPDHPLFKPPRSWSYATDELIPHYRRPTAIGVPKKELAKFRHLIGMFGAMHRGTYPNNPILLDKSQVFTVKAGLIRDAIQETDPRFVLVAMNPYVACGKAAAGWAQDLQRASELLDKYSLLRLAAEHWKNSMNAAFEDIGEDLLVVKFETFLHDPAKNLRDICEHVGIPFSESLLPQPHDRFPFGTRFRDRWYPLQQSRGKAHIQKLTHWAGEEAFSIIDEICGDTMSALGYRKEAVGGF